MDAKKIVFMGDSHMAGTGAEWPHLWGHLPAIPKEFRKNMWVNYIRHTEDTPQQIYQKFKELTSQINFDFENDPAVLEYREKFSWQGKIAKRYNLEYINIGFNAYNLYQIAAKLLLGQSYGEDFYTEDFTDCLVVLGLTDLSRDLLYHGQGGTGQLQNVSIPYIGITLNMIREFVEARGGKFTYFHVTEPPAQLYDPKFNPFFKVMNNYKLFDRSLYSYITPTMEKKIIDGIHYDMSVHNFLQDDFAKEFENSLIFSILMA